MDGVTNGKLQSQSIPECVSFAFKSKTHTEIKLILKRSATVCHNGEIKTSKRVSPYDAAVHITRAPKRDATAPHPPHLVRHASAPTPPIVHAPPVGVAATAATRVLVVLVGRRSFLFLGCGVPLTLIVCRCREVIQEEGGGGG